jgi:hypothetical protein
MNLKTISFNKGIRLEKQDVNQKGGMLYLNFGSICRDVKLKSLCAPPHPGKMKYPRQR